MRINLLPPFITYPAQFSGTANAQHFLYVVRYKPDKITVGIKAQELYEVKRQAAVGLIPATLALWLYAVLVLVHPVHPVWHLTAAILWVLWAMLPYMLTRLPAYNRWLEERHHALTMSVDDTWSEQLALRAYALSEWYGTGASVEATKARLLTHKGWADREAPKARKLVQKYF